MGKEGPFGAFCAGGDIRFFHQAALAGDPRLEDFFTEEYTLNHLIHTYPKPYIAFLDGIVMGGGMGISARRRRQPAHRHRAHEDGHARDQHRPVPRRRRRLVPGALPRAHRRVPGADRADDRRRRRAGGAAWRTRSLPAADLPCAVGAGWHAQGFAAVRDRVQRERRAPASRTWPRGEPTSTASSGWPTVADIVACAGGGRVAVGRAKPRPLLRKRSPLMLHVTLEQVRRGRGT